MLFCETLSSVYEKVSYLFGTPTVDFIAEYHHPCNRLPGGMMTGRTVSLGARDAMTAARDGTPRAEGSRGWCSKRRVGCIGRWRSRCATSDLSWWFSNCQHHCRRFWPGQSTIHQTRYGEIRSRGSFSRRVRAGKDKGMAEMPTEQDDGRGGKIG